MSGGSIFYRVAPRNITGGRMIRDRGIRCVAIGCMLLTLVITTVTLPAQTVSATTIGAWAMTGTMKEIRDYHTATLLTSGVNAGKVLVAGGTGLSNPPDPISQPDELYTPANGTWSYTTTGMIVPRWD